MRKTNISILTGLLSATLITGCATTTNYHQDTATNTERDKAVTDAASYIDKLKDENTELKVANTGIQAKLNEVNKKMAQLNGYLQINNYLVTNQQAVIRELQTEWSPHQHELFQAMKGAGRVIEFEVTDAYLFNGYVVVNTAFLSSNTDNSGTVTEGMVWLDPDKKFEPEGCDIRKTQPLSVQEFASLTNRGQIMDKVKEMPASPPPNQDGSWRISQENKDRIVGAGIGIVGTFLAKCLSNMMDESN